MSHRWLSRAGFAALAPLLAAAPAHAATTVSKSGGELVVTAAAAHANGIAVSLLGTDYVVSDSDDSVAGLAGSGCIQLNASTVRCPQPGAPRVAVSAGDRDDAITLAGTFGGRYDGGAGADSINAGATPFLSVLSGGPGNDALSGSQGGDVLDGGTGADVLDGAAAGIAPTTSRASRASPRASTASPTTARPAKATTSGRRSRTSPAAPAMTR